MNMLRYIMLMGIALLCLFATGQNITDTTVTASARKWVFRKYPPHLNEFAQPVLRNQEARFGRKFLRASGLVFAIETAEMLILFSSRSEFSKWDEDQRFNFRKHYRDAFTKPPIVDKDDWYTNYISHVYQGAFNYNALRSQGAPWWQSFLFTTLHSVLWEYPIEGSQERPSIQDLIVTPIGGALFGELAHFATMRMSRNGFKFYEGIIVCILNPSFVLNNGFKYANPRNIRGRL